LGCFFVRSVFNHPVLDSERRVFPFLQPARRVIELWPKLLPLPPPRRPRARAKC
jgi:hypothetical protein